MDIQNFNGLFELSLDAKGRIALPVGIKKQLPEKQDRLVLCCGFDKNLVLFLPEVFDEFFNDLKSLNKFDNNVRKLMHKVGVSHTIEFDSSDRILIPNYFREVAGLVKDLIVIGLGNQFEIWDSEIYSNTYKNISNEEVNKIGDDITNKYKLKQL